MFEALILGAGAAGLACALTAGRRGFRCGLLDHGSEAGRKIRIAGGGKGNVTNLHISPAHYVGEQPDFPSIVLRRCPPSYVLDLLREYAIPWEERSHGQIFCTVPSSRLVDALVGSIRATGGELLLNRDFAEVDYSDGLFTVQTSQGPLCAPRLVIATGSPAWPGVGATDAGMHLARRFGHKIQPLRPVLSPFVLPKTWPLHGLAGISLPARVRSDACPNPETDALLFTHKGLSGPATLRASCFWRPGQSLTIDFLPETPLLDLMAAPSTGKLTVAGLLKKILPDRLATKLLESLAQSLPASTSLATRQVAQIGKTERMSLAALVHEHRLLPSRTEGMARAEAAAGGVDTRDINPKTLESRLVPGLYLAGELLDVTGLLGGYNLHWAWAGGKAVGEAFQRRTKQAGKKPDSAEKE